MSESYPAAVRRHLRYMRCDLDSMPREIRAHDAIAIGFRNRVDAGELAAFLADRLDRFHIQFTLAD